MIPDQDGFVPMSPRKKDSEGRNRSSVYDNVPQQSTTPEPANVFGYGGHLRTNSGRSHGGNSFKHSRESSASSRVKHTPNNVTYVEVGEEPSIPTPDYEGAGKSTCGTALAHIRYGSSGYIVTSARL